MDPQFSEIMSTSVVALAISVIIFLITLVLVVKRLIGFFITLLLLFFAIAAGYAILNHDIVREYLIAHSKPVKNESTLQQMQRKVTEALEELREDLNAQKAKLDEYLHMPSAEPAVKHEVPANKPVDKPNQAHLPEPKP